METALYVCGGVYVAGMFVSIAYWVSNKRVEPDGPAQMSRILLWFLYAPKMIVNACRFVVRDVKEFYSE